MAISAPRSTSRDKGLRVLVVDDNRDSANSLAALARFWGYEVRTAYDGHGGLEAARTFRPDCVLLDLGLPGLDGYGVARGIRQHPTLARTRLIAVTAYSSEEHRRRVREAGFDDHLVKPVDPSIVEELLKMLEQATKLVERTESLARENMSLALQTKELLSEVKQEIKEVKDEIREVKDEIREVREGIHRAG